MELCSFIRRRFFCILTLVVTTFLKDVTSQFILSNYPRAIKCSRPDRSAQRCMPAFENIAFGKSVTSNNTCGRPALEYCVQIGTSGARKICDVCDASRPGYQHPAFLMTDIVNRKNPTWWQSQTLLDNKYPVRLVMELKKKYDVSFIRIRFHTIRPHSFSIYKRETYNPAEQWKPYQFYSRRCQDIYGRPNSQIVKMVNQDAALCSDKYSDMIPLSGGNVAFATLGHRPGRNNFDTHQKLQKFVTVSALRFDLDRLNTFGDEVFGDPKVLRSYYFAISNIAVGGRCKCNGHSSSCDMIGARIGCKCEHDTAGVDCEKCMPLFNDRPWRRGSGQSANPCKQCHCNGLADSCVFDSQLWVDTNQKSGGRCENCKNNTAGIHCEHCKEYHYRGHRLEACNPCDCNPTGSRSLRCNDQGQCACKPGVTGDKCDTCFPGYYGFSATGCRACNCDSQGSLSQNCDASGQCRCRPNVIGQRCDQCRANHFDLDQSNTDGCKPCFCYGHGVSCSAQDGIGAKEITSTLQVDMDGWTIEDEFGNDRTSLGEIDSRSQYVVIRPNGRQRLYFVAPQRYLGNRLSSYAKRLSFKYGIFRKEQDPEVQPSAEDIIFEGAGGKASYSISDQGNPVPKDRFIVYNYKLIEPTGMTSFDFQTILADLTAIKIRVTFLPNRSGAIDIINMESTQFISMNSPEQVTWQEKCLCETGYTGSQCESCAPGFTRASGGAGKTGRCVPCQCNNHGTLCHPETGECQCGDNTAGQNCEICKPGFYGNPTRGNADDCKTCPCVFGNNCLLIGLTVKCVDCPEGHIGDRCEVCQDGYFGDPLAKLGKKTGCQKCDCSGNTDANAYGNCDRLTGACLKCVHNTKNGAYNKCETCADGYYGDALKRPPGDCKACNCYENGTETSLGHRRGDPLNCDSTGRCDCRDNVIGDRCDTCPSGYWNVASGHGCDQCDCHLIGSEGTGCDVISGKCQCKGGVGGRRCNKCAAGHYRFSLAGCISCDCDVNGALHQNCSVLGRCVCRPNVLGNKCDRCPPNKFNLTAGCLSCPKCFDLVELQVNELKRLLLNVNQTTGNIVINDTTIPKDFQTALEALQREAQRIFEQVGRLRDGDQLLFEYFVELKDEWLELEKRYKALLKIIKKIEEATEVGENVITEAEEIIKKILELLKKVESEMLEKSKMIKERAQGNVTAGSKDAARMREIAEEARELAEKHERTAQHSEASAKQAVNQSRDALDVAKKAREVLEDVNDKLKAMKKDSDEAAELAKQADQILDSANTTSNNVISDADALVTEAKKAMPDFKAAKTKEEATQKSKDGKSIAESASALRVENTNAVKKFQGDEKVARKLLNEGVDLRNQSSDLYERAKNASEKGKKAQKEGLDTLKEAQNMKKQLEEFDGQIEESRKNATEAKKQIPRIKQLIKEANTTGQAGAVRVEDAMKQASVSHKAAKEAENITKEATKEIDRLKDESVELLRATDEFREKDVIELKDNIDDAAKKIDEYKKKAEADAKVVEDAKKKSKKAGEDAVKATDELGKSLDEVESLIVFLDGLPEIDMKTLEDAEKRLEAAEKDIDGRITAEIERLVRIEVEQETSIENLEEDLEPLRKRLAHVENLFAAVPRKCLKLKPCVEGASDCNGKSKLSIF